jgi:hypothetical protein
MLEQLNHTSAEVHQGLIAAITNNSIEKTICLFISVVSIVLGTPMLYFIIWFEKFGNDKKQTIINMFISMSCWTAIGMSIFVQTSVLFQYVYGQLPRFICNLQSILKYSIVSSILLNSNATALSHYAYIFWLKNPTAFHDNFWYQFSIVWIYGISLIFMGSLHIVENFELRGIYFCCGTLPPENLVNTPKKGLAFLVSISAILQLMLKFRIFLFKQVFTRPLSSATRTRLSTTARVS